MWTVLSNGISTPHKNEVYADLHARKEATLGYEAKVYKDGVCVKTFDYSVEFPAPGPKMEMKNVQD